MKCPMWEVCITPTYRILKKKYIEEVCSTEEHGNYTHFMTGAFPKKYSPEWERTKKYMAER